MHSIYIDTMGIMHCATHTTHANAPPIVAHTPSPAIDNAVGTSTSLSDASTCASSVQSRPTCPRNSSSAPACAHCATKASDTAVPTAFL